MNSTKIRTLLFNFSALFLLVGMVLFFSKWIGAAYIFALGASGIAVSYLITPTKDLDVRLRRLHRLNIYAGILLIVASTLMFRGRNEWIVCVSIAAVFILYNAFVQPKK